MIVMVDTTIFIIIGVLAGLIIFFIGIFIVMAIKYKKLEQKYNFNKKYYLHKLNQMSMLEYHYRNFKEGRNAFTVLRDMGEVLKSNKESGDINGK